MKTLNVIDYSFVVLYMLIVIVTSIYLSRYVRKTEDYFKAGGKVPWLMAGLSNFVTGYSAFMFVAAAGFTYKNGLAGVLIFTSAFWAYWLGFFVYGVRWRRTRITSPMEILTRRYSPSTTYYYTILSTIPGIISLGMGTYTLCIFISTALGFNTLTFSLLGIEVTGFQLTMVIIGIVMIVYTAFGGFWAAIVSDVIEFLVTLIMTLAVFPLALLFLGGGNLSMGVQRLISGSPEGYFSLVKSDHSFFFFAAYFVNVLMGYNVGWQIAQRYYSVPDERDTKKMAVLCSLLSLFAPLLWIFPVMISRQVFPHIAQLWPQFADPTEASFVSIALLILPHGLIGIVISAIFSATMGQANATFNWLAAVLTKEIYVRLRRRFSLRETSDKAQVVVAKLIIVITGLLGISVALYIPRFGGAFEFALYFYGISGPPLMLPVMIGLLYTRTPWWSAIASSALGLVAELVVLAIIGGNHPNRYELLVFTGFIVSSGAFLFSRRFPNRIKEDEERLVSLRRDLETPVYSKDRSFDPSGFSAYRLVGVVAMIIGGILILLVFYPSSSSDRLVNLICGLFTFGIGVLLTYVLRQRGETDDSLGKTAHIENI
jgi:SSS family solute:Na+ symporter